MNRLLPADLPPLDLREVQPPRFALVMAGELLEAATGMLVLRGDRGGAAFFGLLVEETHVVHAGPKARTRPRFPTDLAAPNQAVGKWRLLDESSGF
jgi:hypothetical protein